MKIIASIGDSCPEEHGGGVVFEEDGNVWLEYTHGVEAENPGAKYTDDDADKAKVQVYRIGLDEAAQDCLGLEHKEWHTMLSSEFMPEVAADQAWKPGPSHGFEPYYRLWDEMANKIGSKFVMDMMVLTDLLSRHGFKYDRLVEMQRGYGRRASLYEAYGQNYGFIELDFDPMTLTYGELQERWASEDWATCSPRGFRSHGD
jgi:hypothetical protein